MIIIVCGFLFYVCFEEPEASSRICIDSSELADWPISHVLPSYQCAWLAETAPGSTFNNINRAKIINTSGAFLFTYLYSLSNTCPLNQQSSLWISYSVLNHYFFQYGRHSGTDQKTSRLTWSAYTPYYCLFSSSSSIMSSGTPVLVQHNVKSSHLQYPALPHIHEMAKSICW